MTKQIYTDPTTGVKVVVDSSAPTVPLADLTQEGGDLIQDNSLILLNHLAGTAHPHTSLDGSGTSSAVILTPAATKGIQALATGNTRGAGSVDLQQKRITALYIAQTAYSTIAGGGDGRVTETTSGLGAYGTIGGGWGNAVVDSTCGFVGGGYQNGVQVSAYGVVCGGWNCSMNPSEYSFIGGGYNNLCVGPYAVLVGGKSNFVYKSYTTVCGGDTNHAGEFNGTGTHGNYATVVGGDRNYASSTYSFVGGGSQNKIGGGGTYSTYVGGLYSVIGGGVGNIITGTLASEGQNVIGGGNGNQIISSFRASVLGGYNGVILSSQACAVLGGEGNHITTATLSSIVGGEANAISSAAHSSIGGGESNQVFSDHAAIAGGYGNTIAAGHAYGFIGGGASNQICTGNTEGCGVICGGLSGYIGNGTDACVVVGGVSNRIEDGETYCAAIGGGTSNVIGDAADPSACSFSVLAGGNTNTIKTSSVSSVIGGGSNNVIKRSYFATISGGTENTVEENCDCATIPGGRGAVVHIQGQQAYATDTFTWEGDAQTSLFVPRTGTTDATETALSDQPLVLFTPTFTKAASATVVWAAKVHIVALGTAGTNVGKVASFWYEALILADANTATYTAEGDLPAATAHGWVVDHAINTDGVYTITVTGDAGTSINWVGRVEVVSTACLPVS